MSLRRFVRKLKLRWLAGLVGGFAFACSGRPANPEVAPIAPRPEPMQPTPGQPDPKPPVPGSPDPLPAPPDGAPVTDLPAPQFESSAESIGTESGRAESGGAESSHTGSGGTRSAGLGSPTHATPMDNVPSDAGVPNDVVELPPVPDALPADASKQPESPAFPCC